jgi:integrase
MSETSNRFNFTVKALEGVVCTVGGGRVYVYDTKVPALAFCVTEGGARTFYLYRRVLGKPQRIKIGAAEELTIEQARSRAGKLNSDIAQGIDPQAEKAAARAETARAITVGDLWTAYKAEQLPNRKSGTAKEYERLYTAHIVAWDTRLANAITTEDCELLKTRVGAKNGQYTANRTLAVISGMFASMGHRFGLAHGWTPTRGVQKFPEQARDRVLSPEELAAVLASIDADDNEMVRDYFRLMLYTGSRKAKLAEMTWQQISIQRKTWTVPGVLMKNNTPLVVNLVDDAVAILERRADSNPTDSSFVFPARAITAAQVEKVREWAKAGKSTRKIAWELGISQSAVMRAIAPEFKVEAPRPFNGAAKAWGRIMARAGITTRTTPHDLRRTFVTNLLESGAALMHVASAVGHRSMETTQKHYSIARQDKVADAVRAGVASMLGEAAAAQATKDAKEKTKAG